MTEVANLKKIYILQFPALYNVKTLQTLQSKVIRTIHIIVTVHNNISTL